MENSSWMLGFSASFSTTTQLFLQLAGVSYLEAGFEMSDDQQEAINNSDSDSSFFSMLASSFEEGITNANDPKDIPEPAYNNECRTST
eukprot:CAMPEP_0116882302 /NCGR_PEP_ID=MMETSP0463-20121206/14505_1 /TAXON_ID=181622 /ORGANISM="Strombidinopsis sp, Strain SopsisLIS2011" /LENGTH=87 /DNA_ID=CAMNT_0004535293 /DNA_START=618 /DNA_END=881 /DNA_ORIENTATION=-